MKLLSLILGLLLFISCSENEGETEGEQFRNALFGTWKLESAYTTDSNDSNSAIAISPCELQSTITFSPDETLSITNYIILDGSCTSSTAVGMWLHISPPTGRDFTYSFNGVTYQVQNRLDGQRLESTSMEEMIEVTRVYLKQ